MLPNLDALCANLPELLLDPVVVVDESGRFVFVNAACERVFGYTRAELIGSAMIDLVHPQDRERTLAAAHRVMEGGSHIDFENRYRHKTGRTVHLLWSARWVEADRVRIAVARDVTELKKSEAARGALYRISEAPHAAATVPELCAEIHKIIDELLPSGNFYVVLVDEASGALVYPYLNNAKTVVEDSAALHLDSAVKHVIRLEKPLLTMRKRFSGVEVPQNGDDYSGDWLGVPLMVGEQVTGAVVMETGSPEQRYTANDLELLQFVSTQVATTIERKRVQERVQRMAHHDELTGLPNRALFYDRFDMALKRALREKELVALLYLDLDGFKAVNDTWGHHAGDFVLQQMAHRILGCVRESDTVARMGGDEFIVLLNNIPDPGAAESTRQRIIRAMSGPFDLGDAEITLSASVGLAIHPDDGDDIDTLLRHADAGMYGMKRQIARRHAR